VTAAWIASGRLIFMILALTVFEVAGIFALQRAGWGRLIWWQVLPNVLAGDFLLLAWLSDMRGLGWAATAGCLLLALISHAADLVLRSRAD